VDAEGDRKPFPSILAMGFGGREEKMLSSWRGVLTLTLVLLTPSAYCFLLYLQDSSKLKI